MRLAIGLDGFWKSIHLKLKHIGGFNCFYLPLLHKTYDTYGVSSYANHNARNAKS